MTRFKDKIKSTVTHCYSNTMKSPRGEHFHRHFVQQSLWRQIFFNLCRTTRRKCMVHDPGLSRQSVYSYNWVPMPQSQGEDCKM